MPVSEFVPDKLKKKNGLIAFRLGRQDRLIKID